MNPDVQRELIPRNNTLHLIDSLDAMKAKLLDAAEQWQLLDDTGRVPAAPSYAGLLQHAANAQALSRDIVQLAADFADCSQHQPGRQRRTRPPRDSGHPVEPRRTALRRDRGDRPIPVPVLWPDRPDVPGKPHGHRPRHCARLSAAHLGIAP